MSSFNKKGFTLVELLAVIVILAILIVVVSTTVFPALVKTKDKAMVVYAQRVLNSANTMYQSESLYDGNVTKRYNIKELMNSDKYDGVVEVKSESDSYSYSIILTDTEEKTSLSMINLKSITINEETDVVINKDNYKDSFDKDSYNFYSGYGYDLIDYSKLLKDNKYINYKTGDLTSPSNKETTVWTVTDYIPVEPGKYVLYADVVPVQNPGIVIYNLDKSYYKGMNYKTEANNTTIQITEDGYIRISIPLKINNEEKNKNLENTVKFVREK